ncbi:MAG: FAD-dependent oxidoreductase [Solobacterium sp.]|nr:FAD-dependent oxidoreductase [Solobacterium sp.]
MKKEERLRYHGPAGMSRYNIPEAPKSDERFIPTVKTVQEAAREVDVISEADVIVVGGGPGGFAAAVAAARTGARTILLERYGHLGGMSTGGLVNIIPHLSDLDGKRYIGGILEELITRLDKQDAAFRPLEEDWGSTDPQVLKYYKDSSFHHFFVRKNKNGEECLVYTAIIDPEIGKNEMNRMVMEAGVKLYLHSWVTDTIMEGNTVKGIIFESKTGRRAVLGKVVIDCTGDGDLIPRSNTAYEDNIDFGLRIKHLCFGFWIGGVEFRAYDKFASSRPDELIALKNELHDKGLYLSFFRGMLKNQENVAWLHPHFITNCQTDVEEMTRMDVSARERAVRTWELLRDKAPGFEKSYIQLTCPQLGTTGGLRLIGEASLRTEDMFRSEPFEDTIAIFPSNDLGEKSIEYPLVYIPFGTLVPKETEGLLVACRAFSSDDEANSVFNLVPHCFCFGQAAGTAAALAVQKGCTVRELPYPELKEALLAQDVILP